MERGNRNTQHTHRSANNPDSSEEDQQRVPMNQPHGQWPQSQPNTTAGLYQHRSPTNRGTAFGSQMGVNLQAPSLQPYGNFPVQPSSSSSAGQSPHAPDPYVRSAPGQFDVGVERSTLSPQAIDTSSQYAAGMRGQPSIAPQSPAGRVTGDPLSTNISGRPQCKIPGCPQPASFNNHIQEQLDYCEAHIFYATAKGFAALCRRCKRLPARDDSKYCSQACSSADGGGWMVRQPSTSAVPHGFAASCQECRRPMSPNTNQLFCSMECETESLVHPSRR